MVQFSRCSNHLVDVRFLAHFHLIHYYLKSDDELVHLQEFELEFAPFALVMLAVIPMHAVTFPSKRKQCIATSLCLLFMLDIHQIFNLLHSNYIYYYYFIIKTYVIVEEKYFEHISYGYHSHYERYQSKYAQHNCTCVNSKLKSKLKSYNFHKFSIFLAYRNQVAMVIYAWVPVIPYQIKNHDIP